jgi:hypothetical protein
VCFGEADVGVVFHEYQFKVNQKFETLKSHQNRLAFLKKTCENSASAGSQVHIRVPMADEVLCIQTFV